MSRIPRVISVLLLVAATLMPVKASESAWYCSVVADNGSGCYSGPRVRLGVAQGASDGVDTRDAQAAYQLDMGHFVACAVGVISGDAAHTYCADVKAGDGVLPKVWSLRVDAEDQPGVSQIRLRFYALGSDFLPPSTVGGTSVHYVLKMVNNRGVAGAPANGTEWVLPDPPSSPFSVWYTLPDLLPARHLAISHTSMIDNGYELELRQEAGTGGSSMGTPEQSDETPSEPPSTEIMSVTPGTIASAKAILDGDEIELAGKVVTVASGLFDGCIYVEESDRSAGIRVQPTAGTFDLWDVVTVDGHMGTTPDGERYVSSATVTETGTSDALTALVMPNRALGGAALGEQQGIPGSEDLNNIGLLVRASGRITYSGGSYVYMDDGSSLDDGSGHAGVRVETNHLASGNSITLPTTAGESIAVTGISSCGVVGQQLTRVLRPRTQNDIYDRTPPGISISEPSTNATKSSAVTYTVTYGSADTVTLAAADVTLDKTGTADGAIAVSGTGTETRTITISSITGDGTLGVSIAGGTASDSAGNLAARVTSGTFTVDNTPPTAGTATSPGYVNSASITVSFSGVADTGSGLAHVELFYKKGLHGDWLDSGQSAAAASGSFTFTAAGEGTYYFQLVAEDNVGNRSPEPEGAIPGQCQTIYDSTLSASGRAFLHTEYLYPGGPAVRVTAHDESGVPVRETISTYGPAGELLSRSGSAEHVGYTYDALYRLAAISDGNGNTTTYQYDSVGNLVKAAYPAGGAVKFGSFDASGNLLESYYDPAGNLLKRIDGNGEITEYAYDDPENLLTDIKYPGDQTLNVHYTYDTQYGRLTKVEDGTGMREYYYDTNLDLITKARTTYSGVPAQEIEYQYWPNGNLYTLTTPAGAFSYGYDGAGRPASLSNPFGETFGWTYKTNNWLETQTLSQSGVTIAVTTYGYSHRGFLTSLKNETGATPAVLLSEFGGVAGMEYDSLGNLTGMTASIPGTPAYSGTTSYTYNTKDQLTLEESTRNGGYSHTFAYDDAGNPTTFGGQTRTFNANNQNTAYTYDDNGNPTGYRGATLTYDPEDRMTAYGNVLSAGYRSDGLRAWKEANSSQTYFIYSGGVPVCEIDASGTTTNTFGPNGLLARHTTAGDTFYTFDPQGSVAQTLDASTGSVTATLLYDAYGTRLSTANAVPYGFGGQVGYYTDPQTGLLLLTHRYYDPEEGRFVTRDPIGYAGGMNLYGYVGGNPANAADPSGLCSDQQWYDISGDYWGGKGHGAKDWLDDHLPWWIAGAGDTLVDLGTAALRTPQALGHLGEGTGTFAANPSWETAPGMLADVGLFGGTVLGAAGAMNWAARVGPPVGTGIPGTAVKVLADVDASGVPPAGYRGGAVFHNKEGLLPSTDPQGNAIAYHEYDVNPLQAGVNRGTERIVTGSDGSAYYTADHYASFRKIR